MAGSAVVERLGLMAAFFVLGCHRGEAAAPRGGTGRVDVEWGGCAQMRPGPVCELGPDCVFTLWTASPEAPAWQLSTDAGPAVRKTLAPMQSGWAMSVQVPAGARRISVVRPAEHAAIWSLALGTATLHPDVDALVLAGKHGDSQAPVRLRGMTESAAAELRGAARAGYGRVMLAQGFVQEAERALRDALAADRAEGRISDELRDASALFWALVTREHRFAEARSLLATLNAARHTSSDAEAWYEEDAAMLALEAGDVRAALAGYRDAFRREERLGASQRADGTAADLARALKMVGRKAEAIAILDRLPLPADPCARAARLVNRAEMLAEAAANEMAADQRVKPALAEAEQAVQVCGDLHRRLLAMFDATQYALATRDLERADALILRLKAAAVGHDPLEQVWRDEAVARWSLARGRPADALAAFTSAAAVAQAAGLDNERFRAEVGAGEAQLALGRRRAGIAALEAAQELQRRLLESIPLGEGRGGFLSGHVEGTRHLVDALVASGEITHAMWVARRARSLELRFATKQDRVRDLPIDDRRRWDAALERYAQIRRAIEAEARDDWKLAGAALARARADRGNRADDARAVLDAAFNLIVGGQPGREGLPRLAAGEAELAMFPGVTDWIAFLRTPETVVAHRFPPAALETEASASAVLRPFAPRLRPITRIYVLAFGRADLVSWTAVPLDGRPLVAGTEVVYRVDLSKSGDQSLKQQGATNGALIVTNPTNDLAAARAEGDLVANALAPWRLTRLQGAEATRDALLRLLPTVTLFHYAGHAVSEGPSGADSSLILAGGERADLGDLLALPRMPEVVVLAACRSGGGLGPSSGAGGYSEMGLAEAFLAAGAHFVVAPQRDVDDSETRAFVATLYQGIAARGLDSLASSFQRAVIQAHETSAGRFRLMSR